MGNKKRFIINKRFILFIYFIATTKDEEKCKSVKESIGVKIKKKRIE